MLTIRKAKAEDFEEILELLKLFNNKAIDKEQWKRLFIPACKKLNNDFFGVALVDDDKIVGFFSGILSQREVNSKIYKICNLSSLIVHPDYRKGKRGLSLVTAIMDFEDYHFQALSAVKHTISYYVDNFGYKVNNSKYNTILAIPAIKSFFPQLVTINNDKIRNYLNKADCEIYNDHQLPDIFHVLYKYNNEYVYCIIKPTLYSSYILNSSFLFRIFTKAWFKIFRKDFFKSKIKLGLVHYTNNSKLFSESISSFVFLICRRINVMGLSVNDKLLKGKTFFAIKNNINCSGLYKSDELKQEDFDTLYSELTLLTLNHFQL